MVLYYLKSDTLYKFSLRFLDVDNDVVRSQTVTARTQASQTTATPTPTPLATQPTATPTDDPPMNFRVSGVDDDSVSLQWERAPRNRGIVSGKIEAHEHMGSAYQFVVSYDAGLLAGELRASHLRPDTLYKFILIFSNFAGDVVRRQTVTERTQATQTTATPDADTNSGIRAVCSESVRAGGRGRDRVALDRGFGRSALRTDGVVGSATRLATDRRSRSDRHVVQNTPALRPGRSTTTPSAR